MKQDGSSCAEAHKPSSEGEVAVKRTMLFVAVGVFALWAQAGSAQAPAPTTLSFYEAASGGTFKIVDTAPRSPVKNPESRKYRFSAGDQLIFSEPVFDHKGGTKVATLYVQATAVKGKTFASLTVLAQAVYVLTNGDQITAHGVFSFATDARIAIVGGTGAYAGARGFVVSHSNPDDSSQDTLTLLP
jgi:Dirigent-like protein